MEVDMFTTWTEVLMVWIVGSIALVTFWVWFFNMIGT